MFSWNQSSRYSKTAEYDSFEIRPDRCEFGLRRKNGKNVFPLNMSFSVLKSLKQLAWRCLVETRAQNIQKRPNTTRLKYGRTGVSLDLGKKNGKNVFPLNMSFTVLKSLKQLAWRCLVKTRAQNIQKRPNTTRLKYGRTRVSLDLGKKNRTKSVPS